MLNKWEAVIFITIKKKGRKGGRKEGERERGKGGRERERKGETEKLLLPPTQICGFIFELRIL